VFFFFFMVKKNGLDVYPFPPIIMFPPPTTIRGLLDFQMKLGGTIHLPDAHKFPHPPHQTPQSLSFGVFLLRPPFLLPVTIVFYSFPLSEFQEDSPFLAPIQLDFPPSLPPRLLNCPVVAFSHMGFFLGFLNPFGSPFIGYFPKPSLPP